jgi:hypothetical protein
MYKRVQPLTKCCLKNKTETYHCNQCQECVPKMTRHCNECDECVYVLFTHCDICKKCKPLISCNHPNNDDDYYYH